MDVKELRTETREVVVGTLCDLCGVSVDDKSRWPEPAGEKCPGDENEVTISHRVAEYGHGEFLGGKTLEVDVCPACWSGKVLPALRSLGLKRDYVNY